MRFMMMVKASNDSEAGVMPSEELLTAMGRYNEELVKAGALLAGEGLHPSSRGARVRFSGEKRTVVDGPFSPAQDLVAGLADPGGLDGGGDRVGEALPQPHARRIRDRDPPGV